MPIMGSNKYIRKDLLLIYHVNIQMYYNRTRQEEKRCVHTKK